jgi:hypothetical protein
MLIINTIPINKIIKVLKNSKEKPINLMKKIKKKNNLKKRMRKNRLPNKP